MAYVLEDVKGIGPASAALLRDAGIESAEALAAAPVSRVAAVWGFDTVRATRVIASAETLVGAETAGVPLQAPESPKPLTKKKDKDGKEKKKGKGKKEKAKSKNEKEKKDGKKKDKKKKSDKKDKKKSKK